jgi:hypothetical protein
VRKRGLCLMTVIAGENGEIGVAARLSSNRLQR